MSTRPDHPAWVHAEARQRQAAQRRQWWSKTLRIAGAIIVVDGLLLAALLAANGMFG